MLEERGSHKHFDLIVPGESWSGKSLKKVGAA